MSYPFAARRGVFVDVRDDGLPPVDTLGHQDSEAFKALDRLYRALCAILYNYVPQSGHPGGSISSGRIAQALVFGGLDYDVSRPGRDDADVLSYAAGHKAMGLYSLWALRDEIMRLGAPELLPDLDERLRLEDLLGFRRNPLTSTPLFERVRAKALDGHPTPATPFVRLATGASGVGMASSVGLALAVRDYFGGDAPRVHVIEGEGGMTPGRVAEALAAAGTARLDNLFVHVDWNQSSIDSDRVCREGGLPGDYVQWDPCELFLLHDWNVVYVQAGMDFRQLLAGQRLAARLLTGQPTAVVYRTVKGWQYGMEGRASHGAGHQLCSDGFYKATSAPPRAARCRAARGRSAAASSAPTARPCSSPASGRRSRPCARSSRRAASWSRTSAIASWTRASGSGSAGASRAATRRAWRSSTRSPLRAPRLRPPSSCCAPAP